MNNYKEFNQFEYLKDLDNFEKYEIHFVNNHQSMFCPNHEGSIALLASSITLFLLSLRT